MDLGVALPQYMIDVDPGTALWPAMFATVRRAEAAGLDAVWLSDHPFAIGPDGVASGALEPMVSAAALLRAVPRIRVGTLVLASTMRAPGLVAHAARAADAGGGRFVAGVGAGWYEPEHRAFGLPLPPYDERIAGLEATVDALAALGDRRPQITCGGAGNAVLELSAARADGWNVAWDVSPAAFQTMNERLDAACERAGRDPRSLRRSVGVTVLVADEGPGLDRAVERLRSRASFLRSLDRATLEEKIVCGTAEACAERLASYCSDEIVAALLLRDDPEMLDTFAQRVAPLLR